MAAGDEGTAAIGLEIRKKSEILNDLDRLIGLGTVDIQILRPFLPAPGLEAPDGWQWLPWVDIAAYSVKDGYVDNFPLARAVYTLVDYLQIQVTYIGLVDTSNTIRLRIYSIPTDIEGAHYLPRLAKGPQAARRISLSFSLLLSSLSCSPDRWNGEKQDGTSVGDDAESIYGFCNDTDSLHKSLFELYNTIPFSDPTSNKDLDYVGNLLVGQALGGDPPGVRTELYRYQRETIATMIGREIAPGKYCMPNMEPMTSPRHTSSAGAPGHFYYSWTASRTVTYNKRPLVEFHTCLHPPMFDSIPGGILAEDMGLGKTLMCLALICITRDQVSRVPYQYQVINGLAKGTAMKDGIDSLMNLCANAIRFHGIPWRDYADEIGVQGVEAISKPSYYYNGHYRILLSSTTLLVCPDTLVEQWQDEMSKHLEPGYLSVLCISDSKVPIPDPDQLIQYDLIILSLSKFSLEQGGCGGEDSPLMRIHWKRLIIDEGHSMGSHSTRAVILAGKMAVERRWAVTGTPTRGLIGGLEFDNNRYLQETPTPSPPPQSPSSRRNTEMNDLKKLKALVCDFLKLRPWYSAEPPVPEEEEGQEGRRGSRKRRRRSSYLPSTDENGHHLWRQTIEIPYTKLNSTRTVERLLNQTMIRHQFKDISREVQLPPLYHKVVLIEPSFYNKVSLNLFAAVIASNAVTSERTDQDYLFHSSNRAFLRRLVYNLQNATFHWSGFSRQDVEALVEIGLHHLNKGDNQFTQTDAQLLHQAVEAGRAALKSRCWTAFAENHEMAYFIQGLPQNLASTWEGLAPSVGDGVTCYWVFSGPQLLKAQEYIKRNGYNDNDAQLEAGIIATQQKEQQQHKSNNTNKPITPRISSKDRWSEESQYPSHKPGQGMHNASTGGGGGGISERSRLAAIKLTGTASGKLTYLVDRLVEITSTTDEKCIVFYEHPDTAFYIAEALELVGLKHLIYATSLRPAQRASYLVKFNNPTGLEERVVIMDVHLAAHGLDLSTASRIFFVNLVWQPNIEAQAKKRAHRIGQTRPVYVETLVLADTIEEALYNRRQGLIEVDKTSSSGFFHENKELTDDGGMQSIISAAQFLQNLSSTAPDIVDSCFDNPRSLFAPRSPLKQYDSFTSTASTTDDLLTTESISSRATTPDEAPRLVKRVRFA